MNNYYDGDTMKFDKTQDIKKGEAEYGYGQMPCGCQCAPRCGSMCSPIYECPQERVCHRVINYEVPHIMPCNTRIINHHVYRHTFTPCYSACEENVVSNVYDGRCC